MLLLYRPWLHFKFNDALEAPPKQLISNSIARGVEEGRGRGNYTIRKLVPELRFSSPEKGEQLK